MKSIKHFLVGGFACIAASSTIMGDTSSFPIPDELDLNTAIEYGLEHNFEIQKAQQRIREQEGLIVEIKSNVLPKVSLDGSYVELDSGLSDPDSIYDARTNSWSVSLNLKQPLYYGGAYLSANKAAKLSEEAALLNLQATVDVTLLELETRFYDAILARDKIAVQEENVRLLEKQTEDARNRFEVGDVSSFEVLRSEVELANAQPALIRARNNFRISVEELRQSLGFSGGTEQHKVPDFIGVLDFKPVAYEIDEALEQALTRRPDLVRLERLGEVRKQAVKVERAGRRPRVDLVGGYQFNRSTSASSSFSDSLDGWTVGLQSSWNVFDGRRATGRLIQARSMEEMAELDYRSQVLSVEVEVRRAYSNLQEAEELAAASRKVSEQAEEALRLAEARYESGGVTQLDVLQVRVSLTQARTNQLEAFYSYKIAEASMRKAIGQISVSVD
tara:strand:- start:335 stop:1672 length:1338 start_codon:yes stop_codon:yes gene_type:complete